MFFNCTILTCFKALEGIGYTAEGQEEISILSVGAMQQAFGSDRVVNEWDEEVYEQLDFSRIPESKEDLLTILSEKPVFYPNGDFKSILKMAYTAVAKGLAKRKENTEEIDLALVDRIEEIEILLDEERDFLNAALRSKTGKILLSFEEQSELMAWVQKLPLSDLAKFSPALKSLMLANQFAAKLIQQSAYLPQLLRVGMKHYKVRWIPALLNPVVKSIFTGVQSILSTDLLFYKKGKEIYEPTEVDRIPALISFFLNNFVKNNHKLQSRFGEHEIGHLFFNNAILSFSNYENKEYPTVIQLWLNKFFIVEKDFVPVLQVDENEEGFAGNDSRTGKIENHKCSHSFSKSIDAKEILKNANGCFARPRDAFRLFSTDQ